ncbi:hypothetical protein [Endozoicomonas acroporae]|uniref:hypothetical protein n=1 Tax=Endozoicomonas acroporae TaxID=1701104 RepID=UPI000C7867DD|nr:hypothetical protein [Endozoicomonas acroporae]
MDRSGYFYKSEFADMTEIPVSLEELQSVSQQLVEQIHIGLSSEEKQFLLSFKRGEPDWSLLAIDFGRDLYFCSIMIRVDKSIIISGLWRSFKCVKY